MNKNNLAHTAQPLNVYPGETVTFHTRVIQNTHLSGLTLAITIPDGMELEESRQVSGPKGQVHTLQVIDGTATVVWKLSAEDGSGLVYEYQTRVHVNPALRDINLTSRAQVLDPAGSLLGTECTALAIRARGRYLRYLPELYTDDEFMGRFLMLFESFWQPIDKQVGSIHYYFDPGASPTAFLPWLASWLGLDFDEDLREARQRQLISMAVSLHRRRGTKDALKEYLEIYTGGQAQIIEHCARDFRLGPQAELGPGIALGSGNQPHTFSVDLRLPTSENIRGNQQERQRHIAEQRHRIVTIIEEQKPAHTAYTLNIEWI